MSGDKDGGGSANIDIFLRIRPVPRPSDRMSYDFLENKVEFNLPHKEEAGYVNNMREHYKYHFNGIISPEAKQDEVYDTVAKSTVLGALEGINGTVFAYGQTGSGKTFTITGGAERYVDRGIIPRSISHIFSEISKRSDYQFVVHISYLEIYNEMGYDLLDPGHETKSLEDLPKVTMLEDDDGKIHMRNLSMHRANTEEEALNLLFLGDTNRMISETPMNMASSRSHCVFSVSVEARKAGEERVRKSKLNMVDLAGSERVSKTRVNGQVLQEAKYINLSLHYLEQVIIALQERATGHKRPHVPYRNSMMTSVLRDSLGGNCKTVMVATVNQSQDQLDESISTCRFAQRVAMVNNVVMVNEDIDPGLVIRRLKQEVRELKEEIKMLKGGEEEGGGDVTEGERSQLKQLVQGYLLDRDPDAALNLGGSMKNIRAGYRAFKELFNSGGGKISVGAGGGGAAAAPPDPGKGAAYGAGGGSGGGMGEEGEEMVRKLKLQVQQRDNEINILVGMLKKRETSYHIGGAVPILASPKGGRGPAGAPGGVRGSHDSSASGAAAEVAPPGAAAGGGGGMAALEAIDPQVLLADRNKAFELFRKSYRKSEVIEENKAVLKQKYTEAKALGEQVNATKRRINELKVAVEQRRVERGMQGLSGGEGSAADPEEDRFKEAIEGEKSKYKESFNRLRDHKKEIEHLQLLLEQSRARLQSDFEQWLGLMLRQQGPGGGGGGRGGGAMPSPGAARGGAPAPAGAGPRQAWGAPDGGRDQYGRAAVAVPSQAFQSQLASPPRAPGGGAAAGGGGAMLTGNAEADADIIAFYQARERLVAQKEQ